VEVLLEMVEAQGVLLLWVVRKIPLPAAAAVGAVVLVDIVEMVVMRARTAPAAVAAVETP
jgi:hypothetical protein